MGFATLNGIQFYGIPIRSSCLYSSAQELALPTPNNKLRHEKHIGCEKEARLSNRRSQLVASHWKLVPAIMRSNGYIRFSYWKKKFVEMHMFDGLIRAAARWNPLHRVDGKRVKFATYAYRVIQTNSFNAIAEWKKRVRFMELKANEEMRVYGNPDFVPDPDSVKERHPYEGYDDLQWESLLVFNQNYLCRDAKSQYEISLRHYGRGETLQSIGDSLGISKERVRQIIYSYRLRVLNAYRLKCPV